MSQNAKEGYDPMDPIGTWRSIRDANLDAWAKSMAAMTNTDAFAQVIGSQLDTLLAASAPFQQTIQQTMEQYLAQAQMPSRTEVVSLAERLTNIEFRLDDLQAALDDLHGAIKQAPAAVSATVPADLQTSLNEIRAALNHLTPPAPAAISPDVHAALDEIRATLKQLTSAQPEADEKPASPRRTRKTAAEPGAE